MSTIRSDLQQFHDYVDQRLSAGDEIASIDDLFADWRDACERDEVNAAIRRGLADVEAGRYQDADATLADLREEFRLPRP